MTQAPVDDLRKSAGAAERLLIVLAGSNGAGKSTFFAQVLAPLGLHFVNADLLARELNPDDPSAIAYEAAALAIRSAVSSCNWAKAFAWRPCSPIRSATNWIS